VALLFPVYQKATVFSLAKNVPRAGAQLRLTIKNQGAVFAQSILPGPANGIFAVSSFFNN